MWRAPLLAMLRDHVPYGTYHCANTTPTTWYELAQEVARQLGSETRIEPVIAADLNDHRSSTESVRAGRR